MRARSVVPPVLAALLAAQALLVSGSPAAADQAVTVTVNTRAGLEVVSEAAVGVNHAIWDTHLGSDEVADLLKGAGVKAMRYPGGSYSDIYHWETHTAPGGYVAPNTDFDTFMRGVRRAGGQAIVTANYGTGTPEEAAEWVRYANVEKGYGVEYWEIGNENYGNGHYGSGWEADHHPRKDPAFYATQVRDFATAMKAVDPDIKIGAVLTTPGEWPDGITAAGDTGSWNEVVLEIAGPVVDFGIIHWYPTGDTAAQVMSRTDRVVDQIAMVREQSRRIAGKDLGIALTEVNTSHGRNTQPGALFAADAYATMIGQGVFSVDWWNVHNGIGQVREIAGHPDYDDYGLLSSGTCTEDGSVCQPALNTPFAPYHAISMVSKFARPGDQLVTATATDPLVRSHAARRPDGGLAVMLVNQDPTNAKTVALRYSGYSAAPGATVLSHGNGDTAITTTTGSATSVTLAPYSITTLVLRPSAPVTGPSAPARPVASAVTATSATLSWPTPPAGVKYEIHRVNGDRTEQWGETTGGSFRVANLAPATKYTVNLVARDNEGKVSWSSPPLTFTTGTPAESSCAVSYRETANWGNGFVADVEVTNTGSAPVNGWTLTYAWPTGWQQVGSGWNATWTQTGRQVSVVNEGALAPGGSVTVGFVGNYQGPNVTPLAYRLNGVLCTTR